MRSTTPENLIKTCRRFGQFGPFYEVTGITKKLKDGDLLMHIHVLGTDQEMDYRYSQILNDPIETLETI